MGKLIFIFLLMGGIIAGCTSSPSSESGKIPLLVGTYTGKGSEGIYLVEFDTETGKMSEPKLAAEAANPSYLSISKDRKYVYSVCERDPGSVCAYSWEANGLSLINKVSSEGLNPCYIDFGTRTGMVAAANYSSGNVSVFRTSGDGSLAENPFVYQHEGSGPNKARQEAPHAHCAIFSPDERFVYVVDLGIDQIKAYPVLKDSVGEGFAAITMQPGDGPRHLVFNPDANLAFVINELSSSVAALKVDPQTGKMEEISRAETLPADFSGDNKCADIHVSSDGKFLYASNRGHDSIAIFSIAGDGSLERIGIESVQGSWPRNFTLSPDEKFLLVANRNTNNITVFKRNMETGLLEFTGNEIAVFEPVCLKF